MSEAIATLGMYPFEHLRRHWETLWDAVADRTPGVPPSLSWPDDLDASWRSPALVLGMTCGWPLVTELAGQVDVVGAFDMDVPFATEGHYRSVLVASKPRSFAEWRAEGSAVAAVNGHSSLSGWVSLCVAWGAEPERVVVTGAHVESLRAVATGRAQVASIDAVSFAHAVAVEPALGAVHVVGHGPVVPCLPLVTAAGNGRVAELRSALVAAVADPGLRRSLAALRIRGFVPLDERAYAGLRALAGATS